MEGVLGMYMYMYVCFATDPTIRLGVCRSEEGEMQLLLSKGHGYG